MPSDPNVPNAVRCQSRYLSIRAKAILKSICVLGNMSRKLRESQILMVSQKSTSGFVSEDQMSSNLFFSPSTVGIYSTAEVNYTAAMTSC